MAGNSTQDCELFRDYVVQGGQSGFGPQIRKVRQIEFHQGTFWKIPPFPPCCPCSSRV